MVDSAGVTDPVVLVDVADRIATITLNRPEARNALSRALGHALWDAVGDAGDDPDVDAVVLTGRRSRVQRGRRPQGGER